MIAHKEGSHLCRNLEASNPSATIPLFSKDEKICSNKVCIRPSSEDPKYQSCHAAEKKCCGSGNLLIWRVGRVSQIRMQYGRENSMI